MSPAPNDPNSNHFSNRVRANGRLSEYWPGRAVNEACVWAVADQLLFTEDVSPIATAPATPTPDGLTIDAWLTANSVTVQPVANLYDGITKFYDAAPDVHVVSVTLPPGQDIFWLARELRLLIPGRERGVSPNHVLIPAMPAGDGCPYGPPREWRGPVPPPLPGRVRKAQSVPITLLDSGFCWNMMWLRNPLAALGYHKRPNRASFPVNGEWRRFASDVPDADRNGRLDALAGHANFVAGIVAQRTSADLEIWNHNAGFIADDLSSITSEASVLRSLVESQHAVPTPVILVTYAFPAFEGVLSTGWDSVLQELRKVPGSNGFVIVAPAGNQGDSLRRYPAALGTAEPNPAYPMSANVAHPEVIGVGSLVPGGTQGSDFSNRGRSAGRQVLADPWVTCSAVGEQVVSTFLKVDMRPEDDPWPLGMPPVQHDFKHHNSWAEWQGTCFAAPKVAVAIGHETFLNANHDPLAAWQTVSATGVPDPNGNFGVMFPNL